MFGVGEDRQDAIGALCLLSIFVTLLIICIKFSNRESQSIATHAYKTETVTPLQMEQVGTTKVLTVERYPVEGGWVYVTRGYDKFSTTFVPRSKP